MRGHAVVDQVLDPHGHARGLGLVVRVLVPRGLGARGALGDQAQRCGPRVRCGREGRAARGQQPVGRVDHLRGGAVVADQLHHGRPGVPGRELQQVPGRGAREGVDGLGGVPHHAEIVPGAEPRVQQPLLQGRDVLVLVHHELAVLRVHRRGDPLVLLQDPHRDQQDVLEVDQVPVRLEVLVGLVEPLHGAHVVAGGHVPVLCGGRIGVRGVHGDLGPFDLRGHVPHGRPVSGQAHPLGGLREQPRLVVDEPRWGSAHGLRPEVLQLSQRRRVEGARLDARGPEGVQALTHLVRGARREGEREGLLGGVHARRDAPRDAVGDRAGLAGPRPGAHAHRPVQCGGH